MSDALSAARWRLVVLMSVVGLGGTIPAALGGWGWKAAALLTVLEVLMACFHGYRYKDALIGKLLLFGLVVGLGELPTDAFSVITKSTLVYPAGCPMLWASPWYMPFSWMAVMVQMGFLAWALAQRFGTLRATLVLAAVGAAYVPLYEWLARYAQFWYYRDCWMILHATPVYVILAESLICAALPGLLRRLDQVSLPAVLGIGLLESLVIFGASVAAFGILGRV